MIKPVEEDALNMSSKLYVKCPKCGFEDTLAKIPPININNLAKIEELTDFPCPDCGAIVWEDDRTKQAIETIYKKVTRISCKDCTRNGISSCQIRVGKMFVCEKVAAHKTEVRPEDN